MCIIFGALESVYTFFAASTHFWDVLKKHVMISVKRLVETRWSAYHEAVNPIKVAFTELVEAIVELSSPEENTETRGSAQELLNAVCDFLFLCFLSLWSDVLDEVNHTQKYLQIKGISFEKCVIKMQSLKLYFNDKRNTIVDNAITFATKMCEKIDIPVENRGRRKFKKMMSGEKCRDVGLTIKQELKRAMFECVDLFHSELDNRTKSMEKVSKPF